MIFEKICSLCDTNGINISRLEKEIGLGNATVRGWKNCKPTAENLKKVADRFGVSVDYFLDDTKSTVQ